VGSNTTVGVDVCQLWVLLWRGLCDELITRPEESCWLECVVVSDLETSWMRRLWPTGGLSRQKQTNNNTDSTTWYLLPTVTANMKFGTYTATIWILHLSMIYLLTEIGLSPSGSSTVHIYTQTIHRTIRNKQYIEQHDNFGRVKAVSLLGLLYPGICLTTEGKARKNLSQGSRV
jgi:hypothetical protein